VDSVPGDGDVAVQVGDDDRAADVVQLAAAGQLGDDQRRVERRASRRESLERPPDRAVRRPVEVVVVDQRRDVGRDRSDHHHRAKQRRLGLGRGRDSRLRVAGGRPAAVVRSQGPDHRAVGLVTTTRAGRHRHTSTGTGGHT
jgi:hypothetical protein